tara:strand:- start:360 stop:590 length:231 start_codon:yes stop_codon:yes gene_type:complete
MRHHRHIPDLTHLLGRKLWFKVIGQQKISASDFVVALERYTAGKSATTTLSLVLVSRTAALATYGPSMMLSLGKKK